VDLRNCADQIALIKGHDFVLLKSYYGILASRPPGTAASSTGAHVLRKLHSWLVRDEAEAALSFFLHIKSNYPYTHHIQNNNHNSSSSIMSFPTATTTADERNDNSSYPMNPHYFSYSASPFLVATYEEEKRDDMDIPSNSDSIPIAIPIVPACYYYSSSSFLAEKKNKTIGVPPVRLSQHGGPSIHTRISGNRTKKPNKNANNEINAPMLPKIQHAPSSLQQPSSANSSPNTAIVFATNCPVNNNDAQKQQLKQPEVAYTTTSRKAMVALVWAIFGLLLSPLMLGMLLGPQAIRLAISAKTEIRTSPQQSRNNLKGVGMATVAIVIGMICTLLSVGLLLLILLLLPLIVRCSKSKNVDAEFSYDDHDAGDSGDNQNGICDYCECSIQTVKYLFKSLEREVSVT
jgi:hypothetical protein